MREQMEQTYRKLLDLLGMEAGDDKQARVGLAVREIVSEFVQSCDNPAIWCYGVHTHMLMSDYMFELKKVRYIIDEIQEFSQNDGFQIIRSDEIEEKQIDGIIISSFLYRGDIAETIKIQFPDIKYLDIYEALYERGIQLENEYYAQGHPYARYARINRLKKELAEVSESEKERFLYESLLEEYVSIKDFGSAVSCVELYRKKEDTIRNQAIAELLQRLRDLERQAAEQVSENNVLMLCIDGLRRRDLQMPQMNGLKEYIDSRTFYYENAYSVSTSTYESLVPAYSGNCDLQTRYYEKDQVDEADCPFVKEAIAQERGIYFYTDGFGYVCGNHIRMVAKHQTASEKIWDFLLDAAGEDNGLFYIHILYESHFSYANPYTERALVTVGSSIFFDFLERNGGKLKTDYIAQHTDALRYLNGLLAPLLERLSCRIVLYADHGNVLLEENAELGSTKYPQLTFGEELIQIPLAVHAKEMGVGVDRRIHSLMELSDIIVSLLRQEKVKERKQDHVKVPRSEIYNADFKYLYRKLGYEQGLEAFEAFLFQNGYKLVVYADGTTELYYGPEDERVWDDKLKENLLEQVKGEITVCA